MSGPSAAQLTLQQDQLDFYQQGMSEATTAFGEQQDLLAQMEAVYDPILAKGPNQPGFSASESNALNAEAVQGTATNYAGAARAVNEQEAAEGGGNNPLPSGGEEEARAQVANAAAGQESSEESQITEANYAAGRQEFEEAGQALSTASGQLNPAGYITATNTAGENAEKTANQINQEKNSWEAPVLGALGSLGAAGLNKIGSGSGSSPSSSSSAGYPSTGSGTSGGSPQGPSGGTSPGGGQMGGGGS
jgi:hypothetical protein